MKKQKVDTAEQFEMIGWMKKIIAVQDNTIALKKERIEYLQEQISLLEAKVGKAAEKSTAPILQLVKK
jgi:hypothetical protein